MPRWPATKPAARTAAKPAKTQPKPAPKARTTSKSKLMQIGDCYLDPKQVVAIEGINDHVCRIFTDRFVVTCQVTAVMAAEAVRTNKPCDPVPQPVIPGAEDPDLNFDEVGPGANPLQ